MKLWINKFSIVELAFEVRSKTGRISEWDKSVWGFIKILAQAR